MQEKSLWRKGLLRVVQVCVTGILLYVLLHKMQWAELKEIGDQLHWETLAISGLVLLAVHVLNVVRWHSFLATRKVRYWDLLVCYSAGLFSSNFLPTGIGGDGVRLALLSRKIPFPQASISVVLDRLVGLASLFILALFTDLPFRFQWKTPSLSASTLFYWIALGVTGLSLAILWLKGGAVRRMVAKWSKALFAREHLPAWSLTQWLWRMGNGMGISVLAQFVFAGSIWLVLQALRIDIAPIAALWIVILTGAIAFLPISINGLGLIEGMYVVVLNGYDVPFALSMLAALLVRALGVCVSLLAGLISLTA